MEFHTDIAYFRLETLTPIDCNLYIRLYSVDLVLVDLAASNITIFYWDEDALLFVPSNIEIQLNEQIQPQSIVSIVPSDYNLDGFLDLLVTVHIQPKSLLYSSSSVYKHFVYFFDGEAFSNPVALPDTHDELLILDYFGNMHVSFLGIPGLSPESTSGNQISIFTIEKDSEGKFLPQR